MRPSDFRKAALKLPDTAQAAHFRDPDFRTGWRIFAALSQQDEGGRTGSTRTLLSAANRDLLDGALRTARQNRSEKNAAPKKKKPT